MYCTSDKFIHGLFCFRQVYFLPLRATLYAAEYPWIRYVQGSRHQFFKWISRDVNNKRDTVLVLCVRMGGEYCARRPMLKNMYRACFHKLFCIFLAVFIQSCLAKTHKHPTPTYFHRHNQDGTLVDRSSPSYDEVFETKFVETISSLDQNTASLSVSTSKDIENGEDVTVTWKNVVKPSAKDWVGLYCPQNDTARKALDYFFVTDAGQFWLEGYGSRTVKLFNLRTECEFRYYRNEVGGEYTALVARSNLVTFKGGPDQPQHGHLSLTNDPSQMRVMWISGNGKIVFTRIQ